MSAVLAAITLALVLAGMAFCFASARSMEAQLDSGRPYWRCYRSSYH